MNNNPNNSEQIVNNLTINSRVRQLIQELKKANVKGNSKNVMLSFEDCSCK